MVQVATAASFFGVEATATATATKVMVVLVVEGGGDRVRVSRRSCYGRDVPARVIFTSSAGHQWAPLRSVNYSKLTPGDSSEAEQGHWNADAESKWGNIAIVKYLDRTHERGILHVLPDPWS